MGLNFLTFHLFSCNLLIFFSLLSCASSTNDQKMNTYTMNSVVQEYVDKTVDKNDAEYMKSLLRTEIDYWIENYSSMGFYKEEDFIISDIMLFAVSKDKVLLIIHSLLKDSPDGEAKVISAKLNNDDKWEFRYAGLPTFYYEYNEQLRKGQQFTEYEILVRTVDHLVEDGLVNMFGHISQDYLKNKWF